jgi:hypothetical protein
LSLGLGVIVIAVTAVVGALAGGAMMGARRWRSRG